MKKIGIIVADDGEYTPLTEKLENSENVGFFGRECRIFKIGDNTVYALLCGIGNVNAAAAAMYLYSKGCDTILNYGYSGGISGVKKGDIVINNSFIEHDFDLVCLGYKPCEKPGQEYIYSADKELVAKLQKIYPSAILGRAVSGDCFVSDDELRNILKNDFGAVSCDMETAAMASVCYQTGMKFACVRQISDDAGDDASVSYKNEAYSGNIAPADGVIALIKAL
jgi:adenosylhomocysteine nucleosidase